MLKRHFRILLLAPEYDLNIQARIPTALCAIHNFIRKHDPNEGELLAQANFGGDDFPDADEGPYAEVDVEDGNLEMGAIRDQIATEMWEAYTDILLERDMQDSDDLDEEASLGDDLEDV